MDYEETFENLTQMVEHYQKDADGLCIRLKVPVEKSGKVEYSVDAEDFKKSKLGGQGNIEHGQIERTYLTSKLGTRMQQLYIITFIYNREDGYLQNQ